jgi:hypothetical protein
MPQGRLKAAYSHQTSIRDTSKTIRQGHVYYTITIAQGHTYYTFTLSQGHICYAEIMEKILLKIIFEIAQIPLYTCSPYL